MDAELPSIQEVKKNQPVRWHFDFKRISQVITQPAQVFSDVVNEGKKATWFTPVVVVGVLVILASLLSALNASPTVITGSTSSSSAASNFGGPGGMGGAPGGMPGMPGSTTSASTTSTTTVVSTSTQPVTVILKVLGGLAAFLITWLILGILAHLILVASGGHGNAKMMIVLAAWACVPVGVRHIMQIIYVLATNSAIRSAGLSGFITDTTSGIAIFFSKLLGQIDIYFFWQAGLLALAISVLSGVTRRKSILIVLACVGLVLIVESLLGLGIQKLSSLNISSSLLKMIP